MLYRVSITDIRQDIEYDVAFGTCDLCLYNADLEYSIITLTLIDEHEQEIVVTTENGIWEYGEYNEYFQLPQGNLIQFMSDFNNANIIVDTSALRNDSGHRPDDDELAIYILQAAYDYYYERYGDWYIGKDSESDPVHHSEYYRWDGTNRYRIEDGKIEQPSIKGIPLHLQKSTQ